MKNCKYSILIICEGENTEPYFFNSIRDEIINNTYDVNYSISISPEPNLRDDELEGESEPSPHKKQRTKRLTKKAIVGEEPIKITGRPPESWVRAGLEELKNDSYDEVWVVFDHDNHPNRKEAFELANEEIRNKKVNIAFTSRSFEYYILLHFEQLYKAFTKTECRKSIKAQGHKTKKVSIKCGTNQHPDDCKGEICINGYARIKKYWDESKKKESMFPLLKDRLNIGFENSAWLRFYSNLKENNLPIYNRNPYVTIDYLVKKLIGNNSYNWEWISSNFDLNELKIEIIEPFKIQLSNNRSVSLIIPANSFFKTDNKNFKKVLWGDKILLKPTDTIIIDTEKQKNQKDIYFGFSFEKTTIMFDFKQETNPLKSIIEELNKLTHNEIVNLIDIIKNNNKM